MRPVMPTTDADMTVRLADTFARIVQVRNLIDSEAIVRREREDIAAQLTADLRELRHVGATADLQFLERVLTAMGLEFTADHTLGADR